jgi:hypothetical protein
MDQTTQRNIHDETRELRHKAEQAIFALRASHPIETNTIVELLFLVANMSQELQDFLTDTGHCKSCACVPCVEHFAE